MLWFLLKLVKICINLLLWSKMWNNTKDSTAKIKPNIWKFQTLIKNIGQINSVFFKLMIRSLLQISTNIVKTKLNYLHQLQSIKLCFSTFFLNQISFINAGGTIRSFIWSEKGTILNLNGIKRHLVTLVMVIGWIHGLA